MFEIAIRIVNICACAVGTYFALFRRSNPDKNRLRFIFSLALFSFAITNAIALAHSFTDLPVFHLLGSYPSTIIPMLLIANLLLIMQVIEKNDLKNRERKLIALQNIGTKATNALDLKQVSKLALNEILEISQFDWAALYTVGKNKDYLELLWSEGTLKRVDIDLSVLPAKELFFVLASSEDQLIDICDPEYRGVLQLCDTLEAAGVKNAFATQLVNQQKAIGVIVLARRNHVDTKLDEQQFITNVAAWLSVAISNAKLYEDLQTGYFKITLALSKAIEAKDPYTRGHSGNVAQLSADLASHLGLNKTDIERAYIGGLLHDIGKIGIPGAILKKPASLTDEEFATIKEHPYKGLEITQPIDALINVSDIVIYHHERFDGRGYPLGLGGENIPLLARIAALADAFDAMTSDRPYRRGMPVEKALADIEQNKGTQFDPTLAAHFITMVQNKQQREYAVDLTDDELAVLFDENDESPVDNKRAAG
ncbi:MAG: HD-GYP domain-containing protein [Candidatus Aquicultor sp.]